MKKTGIWLSCDLRIKGDYINVFTDGRIILVRQNVETMLRFSGNREIIWQGITCNNNHNIRILEYKN